MKFARVDRIPVLAIKSEQGFDPSVDMDLPCRDILT